MPSGSRDQNTSANDLPPGFVAIDLAKALDLPLVNLDDGNGDAAGFPGRTAGMDERKAASR